MFNRNKFTDDDFRDLERYEEYERRKNERIVKGVGNLIYRYFIYGFIWLAGYLAITISLASLLKMNIPLAGIIAMVASFVMIKKVNYIKEYPFKSFIILVFIDFLVILAFDT